MNKSACNKNIKSIIDNNGKLTLEKLDELTKDLSNNHITNYLFNLLKKVIMDAKENDNLDYAGQIIKYIKEVLEINPSINRKSIYKKINKVYELIDSKLQDKNIKGTKLEKELEKIAINLDKLYDELENKESRTYDFVDYIVNNVQNLPYAEKTFEEIHNAVNIKNKKGVSLFNNVSSKFLEAIQDPVNNREDIIYYNNLIMLMSKQESFNLLNNDKKSCLLKIRAFLKSLSTRDKNYREKKFWLESFAKYLEGDNFFEDDIIHDLTKKYNISLEFNKDILEEVEFKKNISEFSDRYIVDEYVVSIDSTNTNILDQALSCRKLDNGNYLLGVHVADILGYYNFDSKIIQESINRTVPIHIDKNIHIPILPYECIRKIGSLNKGENHLARSYFYEITEDFEIVKSKVIKSIISNNETFKFKDVDKLRREGKLSDTLKCLSVLAKSSKDKIADKIVYQSSEIVSTNIGEFFHKMKYPCIYVSDIKEEMDAKNEIYKKLKEDRQGFLEKDYKKLKKIIDKNNRERKYTTIIDSEMEKYKASITAPLRRAVDILNNHAMDVCYFNTPSDNELYNLEKLLNEKVDYINSKIESIKYFETEYHVNMQKVKK